MTKARQFIPLPSEIDEPLEESQVQDALFDARGNITQAADLLGVRSDRLRRYIMAKPDLKERYEEVIERGVDRAIEILFEGMDKDRPWIDRMAASKEFLKTSAAGRRGFRANAQTLEIKSANSSRTPMLLRWIDDEPKGPIIDATPDE